MMMADQPHVMQGEILMLTEKSKMCLASINLDNGTPSVEIKGEVSLLDSHSNPQQVNIDKVFHCDSLLLYTIKQDTGIVVLDLCTSQTMWIQTGENRCHEEGHDFVLGYYQDSKSGNTSYKILSYKKYNCDDQKFEIYDLNSNSWRSLDVTPNCRFVYSDYRVSLKGKTYWFAYDEKEEELGIFLLSFDYTTETFERLRLPYQCGCYETVSLSVVREEKLSVLLQCTHTSKKEIWITSKKIDDETEVMSWSKLFVLEDTGRDIWLGTRFLVDDKEKKVVVCYEKCIFDKNHYSHSVITGSIIGEDDEVRHVDFRLKAFIHVGHFWSLLCSKFDLNPGIWRRIINLFFSLYICSLNNKSKFIKI